MRVLRGVAGALLWIVAAVVGLVGALLSVTVVLLPVGIPLLFLARKLFTSAVRLLMPPKVVHPVKELGKATRSKGRDAADAGAGVVKKARKAGRHGRRRLTLS